jgi:arginyl-tRNA synthetase
MLKKEVIEALRKAGVEAKEEDLELPKKEFGDLAFPCFKLAKIRKEDPKKISSEIAEKIKLTKESCIQKVVGVEGYVNFFFDWKRVAEKFLPKILKRQKTKKKKEKIMIEYSQPNPVHPMHIGHARTTFLGDALSNIYEKIGYEVIRANYINDMGLQVAKLVTAYLLWAKEKKPKGKPDLWLWKYYVKFHEKAKKDESLENEAREILRRFELKKDKEIVRIWNKIVKWCVNGFEETYKKLGIKFDVYFYESDYRDKGKKIVEEALNKKIAFKSAEGTIVSNLEKYGIPNFVLLRSDGTGLYQTSDLGLTVHKFEKYKLKKAIWVVSSQQILYFRQLFKLLELLGYGWVKNAHHLHFEHVVLPEGKMSSREGRAIMLDEVVERLIKAAYREIEKRNPKLSKKKKMEIAKIIGIGALKYNVLKFELDKQITFDWNKMLQFEGDTGPYLQYAHTRCLGILRKAKKFKPQFSVNELNNYEKNLIAQLLNFNEVLLASARDMRPHYLCKYAYELATTFTNFYENCPVLKGEKTNFRLTLVKCTAETLKECLNLLGIEVPGRM